MNCTRCKADMPKEELYHIRPPFTEVTSMGEILGISGEHHLCVDCMLEWMEGEGMGPQAELKAALDLLEKIMDADVLPAELHDDVASAATHFGWWMNEEPLPQE